MTKKTRYSSSPFFDNEFAAGNRREREPVISCTDCATTAHIEIHPTKTVYRCPACNTVLATLTPTAEMSCR